MVSRTTQPFGVPQFLTAVVIIAALAAAGAIWSRTQKVTAVQVNGWHRVAQRYRDSLQMRLLQKLVTDSRLSLLEAEAIAKQCPFVAEASARRIGSTLLLSISEVEPIALVELSASQQYWLGSDGRLVPYAPYYAVLDVPIVRADGQRELAAACEFVKALQQYPLTAAACSEIVLERGKCWCVMAPNNVVVMLGDTSVLHSKLRRVEWLLGSRWWSPQLRAVDVRWQQRVVLQTSQPSAL